MKKRILSMLLAFVMLIGMLPMTASASEVLLSGTCGENATWEMTTDGNKIILTIYGTGEVVWQYYEERPFGFDTLIISEGITDIGMEAFWDSTYLEMVKLPSTLRTIGKDAFYGCTSLREIEIPEGVTSIGVNAFTGTGLSRVVLPSSLTKMESAFTDCENLTEITIPAAMTDPGLDALDFYGCSNLTAIHVAEGNPVYSSVDGVVFTDNGTKLCAFPYGRRGTYVMPEGTVTIGTDAFSGCLISNVVTANTVTTIEYYAFSHCQMQTITLSDGVESFWDGDYDSFKFCENLEAFYVTPGNPYYTAVDGVLFTKDMQTLLKCPATKSGHYTIPDGVASIGSRAFAEAENLTGVHIPDSVTSIGGEAFAYTSLTEVTIPASVTSIGDFAFSGLRSSEFYVTILGDSVRVGRNAVCGGAVYLKGDMPIYTKGVSYPFEATVYYPGENPTYTEDKLERYGIGWIPVFSTCGENLTWSIDNGVLTITGTGPMRDFTSDDVLPWHDSIDEITGIVIGDGVTSIGDYAFYWLWNVKSVSIPDSVQRIGRSGFDWCKSLREIVIPESVTSIGDFAFTDCYDLTSIVFKGDAPFNKSECSDVFYGVTATAYYPEANKTWTAEVRNTYYGGEITWVPYSDNLPHVYSDNVDGTCNFCGIHREEVEERQVVHMFRMYNPNTGEHFYTGSTVERDNLIVAGWQYEGVGFTFPANTGSPVYRLFQPSTGEHLYTMDVAEKEYLEAEGWNYEGIAFNSAYDTEAVQHRLYNPNATVGAYHFTFSIEEKDNLIAAGWVYQGIGWYSCWK